GCRWRRRARAVPSAPAASRSAPRRPSRSRTRGCRLAGERPSHAPDAFPEAVGRDERRRRLEAGVDPAVLAAGVVAGPVHLPLDPFEQCVVRREDAVGEQVAGAFPAVRVARNRAPRRAGQLPLAGEELLVDGAREPAVAVLLRGGLDDAELLL